MARRFRHPHSERKGEVKQGKEGKLVGLHVSRSCSFDLTGDVILNDYVQISSGVVVITHRHEYKHSRGLRKDIEKIIPVDLEIGRDVFIGQRSMIIGVSKIGEGAIIGAGSVLTKDVPPFEIWAGAPAVKVGERREDDF